MGVHGLWRILDLASESMRYEDLSGLKIALDFTPKLNRIVHGFPDRWIEVTLKTLTSLMKYNIKLVIVLETGLKSTGKYSKYTQEKEHDEEYKIWLKISRRKTINQADDNNSDLNTEEFVKDVKELNALPDKLSTRGSIIRSSVTPVSYFEKSPNGLAGLSRQVLPESIKDDSNVRKIDSAIVDELERDELDDIDDETSEDIYSKIQDDIDRFKVDPTNLLTPNDNYITQQHLGILINMLDYMGISCVIAEEEGPAECCRLEAQNVVDAIASDDNNTVLFGGKVMIRNIYMAPIIFQAKTLEKYGLDRARLIKLCMMIDGDYNKSIRKRLFNVGPVRGLMILSHFPDKKEGLNEFKEWFQRHIVEKEPVTDPSLLKFSRFRWLQKLLVPKKFPPVELEENFYYPVVGNATIKISQLIVHREELEGLVRKHGNINERRATEIVKSYIDVIEKRPKEIQRKITSFPSFDKKIVFPKNIQMSIDSIMFYDRAILSNITENSDPEEDEFDEVDESHSNTKNDELLEKLKLIDNYVNDDNNDNKENNTIQQTKIVQVKKADGTILLKKESIIYEEENSRQVEESTDDEFNERNDSDGSDFEVPPSANN